MIDIESEQQHLRKILESKWTYCTENLNHPQVVRPPGLPSWESATVDVDYLAVSDGELVVRRGKFSSSGYFFGYLIADYPGVHVIAWRYRYESPVPAVPVNAAAKWKAEVAKAELDRLKAAVAAGEASDD